MPSFNTNDNTKNLNTFRKKIQEAAAKASDTKPAAAPAAAVKPSAAASAAKPAAAASPATAAQPEAAAKKPADVIVKEVINGDWGNGADRKARLEAAGYDYAIIQKAVDRALAPQSVEPTLESIAQRVIRGEFGNGAERKTKLEAAGYNYAQVQGEVNRILSGGKPAAPANLDDVARAVIRGEYGNGAERRQRLAAAGYDYATVQARVDQLLR